MFILPNFNRYCPRCMIGKQVRVFWPVDSQWYIAKVQQYDTNSGEHLLQYPDGDMEWVRIGEDHTTNTSYKQYCNGLKDGHPLPGGVSFGYPKLGARSTSQSLGMAGETMEPLKKDPMQQMNMDRTSSSMSSFGLGAAIGRQHSFPRDGHYPYSQTAMPPFQMLSPNYTHSFSSRKGDEAGQGGDPGADPRGPPPYLYGARSESWDRPPPNHPYRSHPYYDPRSQDRNPPHYPYEHSQYPYPRARGNSKEGPDENRAFYQSYPSYGHQPPPTDRGQEAWRGHPHPPPNYYDDQPPMYSYPPSHQPPLKSSDPQIISPATPDGATETQRKNSDSAQKKTPKLPPINGTDKQKKAATITWTKEEDEHLLEMVFEMKHPLKWSVIAQNLGSNRTGKQCRERYVNHLNPRLKFTEWTPIEDSVIWRLYATIGTQWAKMSKVIPGRTDNGIKNRFHNLKRQLDREEESRIRAPIPDKFDSKVRVHWIRDIPQDMRSRIEDMWSVERGIGKIAAGTIKTTREEEDKERFGPFKEVTSPTQCLRCGLYAPSVQCGKEICEKTQWCRACTDVPMHMTGNTLRECLNLKKTQDEALVNEMEGLVKNLHVR